MVNFQFYYEIPCVKGWHAYLDLPVGGSVRKLMECPNGKGSSFGEQKCIITIIWIVHENILA